MQPPDGAIGKILAREGADVLLGMVSEIDGAYVALPFGDEFASERQRWNLAELREVRPRYYDPIRLIRVPAVTEPEHGTLEAWQTSPQPIGLLRARLVGGKSVSIPAVGTWFGYPSTGSSIEAPIYDRDNMGWILGSMVSAASEVRPGGPVLAIIEDRLTAAMTIEAAAADSLVLSDTGIADLGPLPIAALEPWIESIHPRLQPAVRRRRLLATRSFVSSIESAAKPTLPDSTARRYRRDWGERTFVDRVEFDRIDLRGLNDLARDSLIRWALELEPSRRLVVQVTTKTASSLVRRLSRNDKLRLLIAPRMPEIGVAIHRLEPDRIHPQPWMRYFTAEDYSFPVLIGGGKSSSRLKPPADWRVPRRVADIDSWASEVRQFSGVDSIGPPAEGAESREWIWRALHHWPNGDEIFANIAEPFDSLAAWIASTAGERWPRWQRLRRNVNRRWLRLMPPESLPLSVIAQLAIDAPVDWSDAAIVNISEQLRKDEGVGLELRRLATDHSRDKRSNGWLAALLLAESSWLPSTQQSDLARWGFDTWLAAPPARSAPAIAGVAELMRTHQQERQEAPGGWRYRMREVALSTRQSDDLHLWANLCDWTSLDRIPERRSLIAMAKHLPPEWWAPYAEQLLTMLSDDDEGLAWLQNNRVPWSGLILRPSGETHRIPCGPEVVHLGCRRTLADRIQRLIVNFEEESEAEGRDSLFDLFDALDSARKGQRPPSGRTHPLLCWLAQPIDKWPKFNPEEAMVGDATTAVRLLSRTSGHHPDLLENIVID